MEDAAERYAMLAVQGPAARGAVEAIASGELPARMRTATVAVAGEECLVCGTGYTGEDGVELLIPPDHAPAVWDALLAQGVVPAGLGARDTLRTGGVLPPLRQRPLGGPQPDRGRPGLVLQAGHGLHRLGGAGAPSEPAQRLVPFAFTGPGIPRQGNAVSTAAGRGRGHQRHDVAVPGDRHRHGVRAGAAPPSRAPPIEVDVRGKARAAEVRDKPLYEKEG